MADDILQEEQIELRPKERVSALLQGETQREEIEEFKSFDLSRNNLQSFYYMTKKEYAKDFYFLSFFIDRIIELFRIHPEFDIYFKDTLKNKPENVSRPMLLTKTDILNNYKELMVLFREFIPALDIFTTISIEVPKKLFKLNIGTQPGIVMVDRATHQGEIVRPTMEFGKGKTHRAYLLWKSGKTYPEISAELQIDKDNVSGYVKHGQKRAIAVGAEGKSLENPPQKT